VRNKSERRRSARPGKSDHAEAQTRMQISVAAARIMAEEGVHDFHSAKRKAADRLNLPEIRNLPSNQEIESALQQHLQLFHADLPQTLRRLRRLALDAMRFLAEFEPRLVGPLLTGAVTKYSDIQLHLSAHTPEEVAFFLQEQGISYEEADKRLRFGGNRFISLPVFRFVADETAVELCVFTPTSVREPPLSPIDGKPMRRANLKEVEVLLT
jgi:hypothetical protein